MIKRAMFGWTEVRLSPRSRSCSSSSWWWWWGAAVVAPALLVAPTQPDAADSHVPAVLRMSAERLQGLPYCVHPHFPSTTANTTACGTGLVQDQALCPRWLHIPKCGTSFRRVMQPWFEAEKPELRKRKCDVKRSNLSGRHHPFFAELGCKAIGVFRHPTQRLLSAFHNGMRIETNQGSGWNWTRLGPLRQRLRDVPDEHERFLEFAREPGLLGCQTKMVLGRYCNEVLNLTRAHIEEAKRRVREDFAFVGILEDYQQSICLFHQQFGGTVSWTPEFGNDRPGNHHTTKNAMGRYASDFPVLDPIDEEVYATAKEVFYRNIVEFHKCPVHVSRCTKERARRRLLTGTIADWVC